MVINYDFPPTAISYIHRIGIVKNIYNAVEFAGVCACIITGVHKPHEAYELLIIIVTLIFGVLCTVSSSRQDVLGVLADRVMPSPSSQRMMP